MGVFNTLLGTKHAQTRGNFPETGAPILRLLFRGFSLVFRVLTGGAN